MEKEIKAILEKITSDQDILAVMIFGSKITGNAGTLSDTDICIVLRSKIKERLEQSRKRLEYLKDSGLDIHIFQQLPLYIKTRVLKEGKVLFCRDEDSLYDLAFRTAQEFEDFRHIYYGYLKEIERG